MRPTFIAFSIYRTIANISCSKKRLTPKKRGRRL